MPFGLNNAPSKFQKRMKGIFGDLKFVSVYIDDILICYFDLKEHKNHLEIFHHRIFKHGIVLGMPKVEFAKNRN